MAMPEKVVQRWNAMTRTEEEQTVDYIDFLLLRRRRDNVPRKTHFQLDAPTGGLEFIADNFDETPEEFEEYM